MYKRIEVNENEARLFASIIHQMFDVIAPCMACTKRSLMQTYFLIKHNI